MHNGPYLVAISQNYSNNDLLFALRCLPLNELWCFGVATSNQYIISHENSTKLSIQTNGNTTVSGNLDVGKVLTLKRIPGVSDTNPLSIINESTGGGTGVVYQSTASGQGFNVVYLTAQSSTAWVEGVNYGGANEFIIKYGSNGLTIKPNGDTSINGNLNAAGRILVDGSHLNVQPKSSTSSETLVLMDDRVVTLI